MHIIFKALPRNQRYSQEQRDRREKPGQPQTLHRTRRVARCVGTSTAPPPRAARRWHVHPSQVTSPLLLPPQGRKKKHSWLRQGCGREGRRRSQPRSCLLSPRHHHPRGRVLPCPLLRHLAHPPGSKAEALAAPPAQHSEHRAKGQDLAITFSWSASCSRLAEGVRNGWL